MADLMACGHTAQGIDSTGSPVCAICVGLTPDAAPAVRRDAGRDGAPETATSPHQEGAYRDEDEGLGLKMSKPFTAYWNVPGYLPDFEPPEFDTKEEALGYLADEIRLVYTELRNPTAADQERAEASVGHLYAHGWTTYDDLFFGIGE